jgi:hypothetical protein
MSGCGRSDPKLWPRRLVVQTEIDNTMIQRWPRVTRKECGLRKWLKHCAPSGITGYRSRLLSNCEMAWTRCSNEFDPSGTFGPRSLNVRSVGMLVKAHSLMSAFVQCSCRSYDSISSAPSRPRRLKSVGRCTGSRTNSTFLAKLGTPICQGATMRSLTSTSPISRLHPGET